MLIEDVTLIGAIALAAMNVVVAVGGLWSVIEK